MTIEDRKELKKHLNCPSFPNCDTHPDECVSDGKFVELDYDTMHMGCSSYPNCDIDPRGCRWDKPKGKSNWDDWRNEEDSFQSVPYAPDGYEHKDPSQPDQTYFESEKK